LNQIALQMVKGIQYSHELLAKISGVKNYAKQMKAVGEMTQDEYEKVHKQITLLEATARDMIRERETRFERAGGVFARPETLKNEFYVRNGRDGQR